MREEFVVILMFKIEELWFSRDLFVWIALVCKTIVLIMIIILIILSLIE